jgi:hypothetical protein
MDDAAEQLYAAWPERLYAIDERGRIALKGAPGPFGFEPERLAAWLAARSEARNAPGRGPAPPPHARTP